MCACPTPEFRKDLHNYTYRFYIPYANICCADHRRMCLNDVSCVDVMCIYRTTHHINMYAYLLNVVRRMSFGASTCVHIQILYIMCYVMCRDMLCDLRCTCNLLSATSPLTCVTYHPHHPTATPTQREDTVLGSLCGFTRHPPVWPNNLTGDPKRDV